MRRLIAPMSCSFLILPLVACGAEDVGDADPAAEAGVEADTGGETADTPAPRCPFTVSQLSEIVGQPMVYQGSCSFGDGNGVALLTVTTASRLAGETTYGYERDQAGKVYREVKDVDKGDKAYLAVKDIGAEAVVVSGAGSYTVTLSSFQRLGASPDGYERTLRALLDALPL
ncbi:hypothetical protein ACFY2R_29630 [Micromonospora olivasterospora]|uniref:DUF3558 domain-containing protein n=1 Tax=Micromonospora olivasterospora TaxID=1880 RepID=A0A562IFR1_MICOL|nr:hypothetical protein [Micromonospora olivasterospora]TWH69800.1 hypothetical protein JD77_04814 [Micromonospora olivasterospora]